MCDLFSELDSVQYSVKYEPESSVSSAYSPPPEQYPGGYQDCRQVSPHPLMFPLPFFTPALSSFSPPKLVS